MPTFAEDLNRVRRERHITQEQLAHEVNVSRQTISHWENGRAVPDIDTIKHLSRVLEHNFLAEDEPSPAPQPEEAPAPAPKGRRKWMILAAALLLAAVAAVIGILLLKQPAPPVSTAEPYTPEWFQEEQTPADGQAFLFIHTEENPVRLRYMDDVMNGLGWQFHFIIMEQNGIPFTVTEGATYLFTTDGACDVFPLSQDYILDIFNGGTLQPGSVCFWGTGMPVQSMKGVGITITGVDANGNELTFRGYVELSREIAEE